MLLLCDRFLARATSAGALSGGAVQDRQRD